MLFRECFFQMLFNEIRIKIRILLFVSVTYACELSCFVYVLFFFVRGKKLKHWGSATKLTAHSNLITGETNSVFRFLHNFLVVSTENHQHHEQQLSISHRKNSQNKQQSCILTK